MLPLLLIGGGLWLLSKARNTGGSVGVSSSIPSAGSSGWAESPPSNAGSSGTGQTSPLAAFLGSFTRQFSTPTPYVPLSGPGGATTSPAASGAPSGTSTNMLLPAAPGTVPDYTAIRADLASMSNPQYWWMGPAIDTAIMSDDVSGAMARAAGMDLTPSFVEASMGMVLS